MEYGTGKISLFKGVDRVAVLLYIALVMVIMGTQMFLAGFLGELVCRKSPSRNDYLIDNKLNIK